MNPIITPQEDGLDAVRRARAELVESMGILEAALAAPASAGASGWASRVDSALARIAADFREHIALTESPGGLHADIVATAPRLAGGVRALAGEHGPIAETVDDLRTELSAEPNADGIEAIRETGTSLLARLARHRQRGADLVYEAYESDIGGET
jgi:hypothetical protein